MTFELAKFAQDFQINKRSYKMITRKVFMFFAFTVFFTFFAATFLSAQTSVEEKLAEIKGDVYKIAISTASGDVVFEGNDAKALFKNLTQKKVKKIKVTVDGDDMSWTGDDDMDIEGIDDAEILKFVGEGDSTNVFIMHDGDDSAIKLKKKVIVSDENGVKKVTVTTTKDGKEDVKIYEGKEADEVLKSMDKQHNIKSWNVKGEKGKKMKKIIINKEQKEVK